MRPLHIKGEALSSHISNLIIWLKGTQILVITRLLLVGSPLFISLMVRRKDASQGESKQTFYFWPLKKGQLNGRYEVFVAQGLTNSREHHPGRGPGPRWGGEVGTTGEGRGLCSLTVKRMWTDCREEYWGSLNQGTPQALMSRALQTIRPNNGMFLLFLCLRLFQNHELILSVLALSRLEALTKKDQAHWKPGSLSRWKIKPKKQTGESKRGKPLNCSHELNF